MEQIRVVREMREGDKKRGRTNDAIRPRFCVWEQVPGAFSSNGGKDFQTVLTEFIRIAEPDAPEVPLPERGKWPLADAYYGDGWSIAYRVHDAQFWGRTVRERDSGNVVEFGTPQRRRRIALVADFNGRTAADILFGDGSAIGDFGDRPRSEISPEQEGLRWDFEESGPAGKEAAAAAGTRAETANDGGTDYLMGWDALLPIQRGGADFASGFPLGFRPENTKTYYETATTLCNGTRPGFCAGVIRMATGQANAEIIEDKCPTLMAGHEHPIICLMDQGGSVMEPLLDKTEDGMVLF